MKRLGIGAALVVSLAAGEALAQAAPQLPADYSYPHAVNMPGAQHSPKVWSSGDACGVPKQNRGAYVDGTSVWTHEDPWGLRWKAGATPTQQTWPDVHGDWMVFETAWTNQEVWAQQLSTGLLKQLSNSSLYDGRPSIWEDRVAWQTNEKDGIAWTVLVGNPVNYPSLSPLRGSFPTNWKDFIAFNAVETTSGDRGIAVHDTSSGTTLMHLAPVPFYKEEPAFPHIWAERVAYQMTAFGGTDPTTVRYMDLGNWGTQVTPKLPECLNHLAPRIGGDGARYLIYTGEECKDGPKYGLYMTDLKTDKVYFVTELDARPHPEDHPAPYDIFNDVIVYVKKTAANGPCGSFLSDDLWFYDFDESQL